MDEQLRNIVGSRTPYTVPENYFQDLTRQVLAKTSAPVKKKFRLSPIIYYASAACAALLISFGGYTLYQTNTINKIEDELAEAECLDNELVESYYTQNNVDEELMDNISEDDILSIDIK